jgi:hypothetical protein
VNRRTVAGSCLFLSPALHLLSSFLWPAGSEGSAATQLATAAAHPGAMATATLTETAGWVLLLPALVVLWSELRDRGRVLVGIGVWGAVLGVLGFTVSGVLNLVTVDLARSTRGAAALTAIRHDGLIVGTVVLPILLGLVALVLLLAGVARAGLGGWWLPVAGAVSVIADQVTSESANALLLAGTFLPMAVALAAVGGRLLTGAAPAPARKAAPAAPSPAAA